MSDITDKAKAGDNITNVGLLKRTLDGFRSECPITPLRIYYVTEVNIGAYLEVELIEQE